MKRSLGLLMVGAVVCGGMISRPALAAGAKDGEAVYGAHCKNCHGPDGAGNPAIAKMMNVTMKPLASADVQSRSDSDLKAIVTAGTGRMKAVTGLAGGDADNLIIYLRTLKK